MSRDPAALVLGGGPAGSMFALSLARAGRAVTLLEKTKAAHDKVCGEFLSHESLRYLQQCGLEPPALGAIPIRKLRFVTPWFEQESDLPFQAWSLTRKCLDEALLQQAAREGVDVLRGAPVAALQRQDGHWSVRLQDDRSFQARDVVVATGKLDVAGWPRPKPAPPQLVAFKMYYRLTGDQLARMRETIELVLFPGGYAGLQLVAHDVANLCLLIQADNLQATGAERLPALQQVLQRSAHLRARLHGAQALLPGPLAASNIPYGHVQRHTEPGLWRVGDQAAVIPSFSGDGTAIALHSGALAARCFLHGNNATHYQHMLHGQLSRQIWLATRLARLLVQRQKVSYAARLYPGLLRYIVGLTRIPPEALRHTQPATER